MLCIYNGISLGVIGNATLACEAVLDDSRTDFLYNRFTFNCTAYINGQVEVRSVAGPPMSYRQDGNKTAERHAEAFDKRPVGIPGVPGGFDQTPPDTVNLATRPQGAIRELGSEGVPLTAEGSEAGGVSSINPFGFASDHRRVEQLLEVSSPIATTHQLIRKRLTDPRGRLFIFNGTGVNPGELILMSPPNFQFHCDCKNGPKPLNFDILHAAGDASGTMVVQFGIETFIEENIQQTDNLFFSALLSNRFSMTHEIDQDSFLTIHVQGEAIFDIGKLLTSSLNPDQLRSRLLLPVPFGCVRKDIVVEGLPDGSGVRYSFTDVQQHVHFPVGAITGIARIEAQHRQLINSDIDILGAAITVTDSIINRRWAKKAGDEDSTTSAASPPMTPGRPRRRRTYRGATP